MRPKSDIYWVNDSSFFGQNFKGPLETQTHGPIHNCKNFISKKVVQSVKLQSRDDGWKTP